MQRIDPYKNFKFRLVINNVAYSGTRLTGVVPALPAVQQSIAEFRAGSAGTTHPIRAPGRSPYDSVQLNRGLTHSSSFTNWASQVADYGSSLGAQVSPKNLRKSVFLEFYDEAGVLVVRYTIDGPLVSETPMSPPGAPHRHALTVTGAAGVSQLAEIFEDSLRRLRP